MSVLSSTKHLSLNEHVLLNKHVLLNLLDKTCVINCLKYSFGNECFGRTMEVPIKVRCCS